MKTTSGRNISARLAAKRAFLMLGLAAPEDIDNALMLADVDLTTATRDDKILFALALRDVAQTVRRFLRL